MAIFFTILSFSSFSQTTTPSSTCNLQVYIDSIVVNPCFRTGGGACGCNNTLWAVVNGGTAPYSYHWTPNGETTDSIFNVCYVEFSVKVTDANGCVAYDSLNVVIPQMVDTTTTTDTLSSSATGINNISNYSSIIIYPIPATDKLLINLTEFIKLDSIEVYNTAGEKVLLQNISNGINPLIVDISLLEEGTYLLKINNSNKSFFRRFIKAK